MGDRNGVRSRLCVTPYTHPYRFQHRSYAIHRSDWVANTLPRVASKRFPGVLYSSLECGPSAHPCISSSSNTISTTPYGGPFRSFGSSEMNRVFVRFDVPAEVKFRRTIFRGSRHIATITREPTSVQRQRLPPHQNSRPIENSLCCTDTVLDDQHLN